MDNPENKELQSLIVVNQESRVKAIQTAQRLYHLKKHLCEYELPALSLYTKSIQNLPEEIRETVEELEAKICSNPDSSLYSKDLVPYVSKDEQSFIVETLGKSMLQNIALSIYLPVEGKAIAAGEAVGAVADKIVKHNFLQTLKNSINIFRGISRKKNFKKQKKKVDETQKSTDVFESAIDKMEFLLDSTEEQASIISKNVTLLSDGPKNYQMMSKKQKNELLQVVEKMKKLSDELTQEIAA